MSAKLILYLIIFPMTLLSVLSLNTSNLFKNKKLFEIKILYILTTMAISYLAVNFIYDFIEVSKVF